MNFIKTEEGKYLSHNKDFEVDLYFTDSLLQVQYTQLCDGVFMPCIDLSEFECDYKCLDKEGNLCPFYRDSKVVKKSEITYFQTGNGKKVLSKVKDWLLGVCDSEDSYCVIEEEWFLSDSALSENIKMDF